MSEKKNKKDYFDEFLSFLPLAVCFVDSEGYILEINEKMEKLLGYKSHELIDSKLNKLFGDDAEEILLKEVKDKELEVEGKGKKMPVIVFSEKRVAENGPSVFIAVSNLNRAKKIEKQMEEKVKELERFNRLATGRELRMVELKRDKKKLKKKIEKKNETIKELKRELRKQEDKQNTNDSEE